MVKNSLRKSRQLKSIEQEEKMTENGAHNGKEGQLSHRALSNDKIRTIEASSTEAIQLVKNLPDKISRVTSRRNSSQGK